MPPSDGPKTSKNGLKSLNFNFGPPIKLARGKKSKFRFLQFLLNNIVCKYAKFHWATVKTLKALAIFLKLDAAAAGRRTPSVHPHRISSADYVERS